MKKYYQYLLFVFPVLYLLMGFYFRQVFGDLSLRSTDPEYIDFISGMCVATGKFSQTNIDHPGAIFQILLAVIFKIIYFFRGNGIPFFEDAITHADLYLAVANLTVTAIISSVMLWAGKTIYKITNNTVYALIIQSAPFIINVWYEISGRIYPELLFVIPVYLLEIQLLQDIYHKNEHPGRSVYIYALAVGFGLSLKMTFLPVAVLPLFVVNKYNNKIKYVAYTIITFFLLSPQVAFQWHHFWNWNKGMFIHSGMYQAGDSNIINTSLFINNFNKILASEKYFFFALGGIVILFLITVFTKKRWSLLSKISSGFIIATTGLIFIVSKQYAIRYFLPALLLYPFLLILINEIILIYFKHKTLKNILTILLIVIIGFQINHSIPYMHIVSKSISKQVDARIQTRSFIKTLNKNSYTIIVSQDYGSPYQQYAIMFSFAMGGKQWPDYKKKLNKLFPDNFMYFTWDNTIKYWGKPYNAEEVAGTKKPVYLYLQKNTKELYKRTIKKLLENSKHLTINSELLFNNQVNNECIMQLHYTVDSTQTTDAILE